MAGESKTQLQRAFEIFQRMSPNLGSANDLALWMDVTTSCAYEYVKELKAQGCITQQGGGRYRPLYGLAPDAKAPVDRRGKWKRRMTRFLEDLGQELMDDGRPKPG